MLVFILLWESYSDGIIPHVAPHGFIFGSSYYQVNTNFGGNVVCYIDHGVEVASFVA